MAKERDLEFTTSADFFGFDTPTLYLVLSSYKVA